MRVRSRAEVDTVAIERGCLSAALGFRAIQQGDVRAVHDHLSEARRLS